MLSWRMCFTNRFNKLMLKGKGPIKVKKDQAYLKCNTFHIVQTKENILIEWYTDDKKMAYHRFPLFVKDGDKIIFSNIKVRLPIKIEANQ